MADIFLSYAREDLVKAKLLAEALETQGWSVFWDRARLLAGQDFDEVIETEIDLAGCMIVIWSEISKKSDWVRGEAEIGREQEKLIPIQIDASKPPIAFRTRHTESFTHWNGDLESEEFNKLKLAVARLAGPAQAKTAAPTTNMPGSIAVTGAKSMPPKPTVPHQRQDFIEPEMVIIPAGSFQMGGDRYDNEKPVHAVTFAKPFGLCKFPVTFAEYDVFAKQCNRDQPADESWGRDRRPVINVSWQDATDYAAWLTDVSGKAYRLPSEAEWEYACRAGSCGEFFWGDDESKAGSYAWFENNSKDKTHPVGAKQANSWALHDMTGNVWEWLQDTWHETYQAAPNDGSAWEKNADDNLRVLRGGSWFLKLDFLRSASRYGHFPDVRFNDIGFRLAQD